MNKYFKAIVVREDNGSFTRSTEQRNISELPQNEVLIKVHYTSLNYKDALSATGNKGITKKYPHTPGIDAAGVVEKSLSPMFHPGDNVIVTGYDLGMNTSGGFAEFISVPASWIVKLPGRLSLKESMIIGTAGFTAALSLYKLELNGLTKNSGEVLVTGATGGVGSMAVAVLAHCGYNVAASTGKNDRHEFLRQLGAKRILNRDDIIDKTGRPMLSAKWAGVIDTIGGITLQSAIASTKMFGSIASCGLVQSPHFTSTTYPFILRGINLLGINSAETPMELRQHLWEKLSSEWKPGNLNDISTEHSPDQLIEDIELILAGKNTGRIIASF